MMNMMRTTLTLMVLAGSALCSQSPAAQTMYKYVDANGKVTYSDRKPMPGEKAEIVRDDRTANVITLPKPKGTAEEREQARKASVEKKEADRGRLDTAISSAEKRLASARNALETGRDPLPGEQQIVVKKGGNSINRTPEYFARIKQLEDAVAEAEKALADAREARKRGVD